MTLQARAEHPDSPETPAHRSPHRDLREPALYSARAGSYGSTGPAAEALPEVWRQTPCQGRPADHSTDRTSPGVLAPAAHHLQRPQVRKRACLANARSLHREERGQSGRLHQVG